LLTHDERGAASELLLGDHRFDIRHRAVVMGILNRTPDSFFDKGSYFGFDDFLRKADQLVADGADFLDVGGVKAGPGPEVGEQEELDRVNDISGFADPDYLAVCAAAGASVVATHIRLQPRVPDPDPVYPDGVEAAVRTFLADRGARAVAAGIPPARVMVDAGLDLGKTEPQSLRLLRASDELVALGFPVFLSASNKRFLGDLCGTEVTDRRDATNAAHALGVALGCRVLRAHDVRGARRTADVLAAVLAARS
jgi:dihydropteroate synthase